MDIETRSKLLREHTRRNKNTDHVNYKIQYLLYDPFIFINAYVKISKNKGALTEGIQDEKMNQLFGLEKATTIAKKNQTRQIRVQTGQENLGTETG